MQIKLGPPLFVPNGQLGSFGALSQLKSLVRNRTDLFDLAFSGPAASGIVSASVFIGGLVLSASGLPKVRQKHGVVGFSLSHDNSTPRRLHGISWQPGKQLVIDPVSSCGVHGSEYGTISWSLDVCQLPVVDASVGKPPVSDPQCTAQDDVQPIKSGLVMADMVA